MYKLELEKAAEKIKQAKAKKVCIQLPDGLKPRAKEIQDFLKEKTNAEIYIWMGTCFGACDLPQGLDKIGIDLLIQWGHSEMKF
ncbi:diphthamide synthesis protein [Candidatus Woesearchaeota archaeon]|nr:diphthamide synthesis protein [Candidatus Woesearchaeota archaeon]MBW3014411.1 diphthamide synthesis protein [Candidatus Woesearchaeota archaeon]